MSVSYDITRELIPPIKIWTLTILHTVANHMNQVALTVNIIFVPCFKKKKKKLWGNECFIGFHYLFIFKMLRLFLSLLMLFLFRFSPRKELKIEMEMMMKKKKKLTIYFWFPKWYNHKLKLSFSFSILKIKYIIFNLEAYSWSSFCVVFFTWWV